MPSTTAGEHKGSLFDSLKKYWTELKEAPSGERFRTFYDVRQETRQSPAARIVSITIGIVLVLLGLSIGWLPGPGGFVAILGLALLAQEFRPLAALIDATERLIVRTWKAFRDLPTLGQGGIITALLCLGVGFAYLTYTTVLT